MTLADLGQNQKVTVQSIAGDEHFKSRITSIGVTEGAGIQMVRNDKKMPVLIFVRQSLIALNRDDAKKIEVAEA